MNFGTQMAKVSILCAQILEKLTQSVGGIRRFLSKVNEEFATGLVQEHLNFLKIHAFLALPLAFQDPYKCDCKALGH